LPPRRNASLLRLLVAFQVLLDFLDTLSEDPGVDPHGDGRQLHLALRDALDPRRPISDYHSARPREDGGYLRALVQACRSCCHDLPSYPTARPLALRGAERCVVQSLNHDCDPARRDLLLRQWADATFADAWELSWWELTAAASSTLGIHALLALAADPHCREEDVVQLDAAYMPWVCAASTMLDSYVDEVEDLASDSHSYIGHYPSEELALRRTRELLERALLEAGRLRNGSRHTLIVAGMVAMYLSADEARTPSKSDGTHALLRAGGGIACLLAPILRSWRVTYRRCNA
jgi:tetraprenyl-beta-curcumene synthase